MKKILALVAALIATPAIADEPYLLCTVRDFGGSYNTYRFVEVNPLLWMEQSFSKDGNKLIHAPGNRPTWALVPWVGKLFVRYNDDKRFTLVVKSQTDLLKGQSDVSLYKHGDVIGAGVCTLYENGEKRVPNRM